MTVVRPSERCLHRAAVGEKSRARFGGEGRRRIALGRPALQRPRLGAPFVEAAVEHRGVVEAERSQHPPEPRRPHHGADAVEHDARAVAEAVAAERRRELRRRRHHEAEFCGGVGELALQIEKIRARDVRFFERMPARHRQVGVIAAGRRRFEIGRAVVDPKVRLAEDRRKLFGADQSLRVAHVVLAGLLGKASVAGMTRSAKSPPCPGRDAARSTSEARFAEPGPRFLRVSKSGTPALQRTAPRRAAGRG